MDSAMSTDHPPTDQPPKTKIDPKAPAKLTQE